MRVQVHGSIRMQGEVAPQADHGRPPHAGGAIDLTFLGTAAMASTKRSQTCSALLRTSNCTFLIDAGDGIGRQLDHADSANAVDCILLTHLHGDHLWGLATVVRKLMQYGRDSVRIVGPPGTYNFLCAAFRISGMASIKVDGSDMEVRVLELVDAGGPRRAAVLADPHLYEGHPAFAVEGVTREFLEPDADGFWTVSRSASDASVESHSVVDMRAGRVKHTENSFGFAAFERPRFQFDKELLDAAGLCNRKHGAVFRRYKMGYRDFELDGRRMTYESLMYRTPGRHVVYLGDTCDASPMDDLVRGCDLLVHEATFLAADVSARDARWRKHSNTAMAARYARKVDARLLLLNHFSNANPKCHVLYDDILREVNPRNTRRPIPALPADDFMTVRLNSKDDVEVHASGLYLRNLGSSRRVHPQILLRGGEGGPADGARQRQRPRAAGGGRRAGRAG